MLLPTSVPDCLLRPWREGDQGSLVRYGDNRRVWRNMTDSCPHPYTLDDANRWLSIANADPRSVHLAIELQGQAIGGIGAIAGSGNAVATADFGYWLGEPYWGRGIMTAAVRATSAYALSRFGLVRLEARVFAWNPASMPVLEKCGFVREGVLQRSVFKDGEVIDSVLNARVR